MFRKIKNLILKFSWYCLPNSNNSFNLAGLIDLAYKFFHDILVFILPISYFVKNFFFDLKFLLNKYFNLIWDLVSKHKLMYIIRLAIIIYLLYRPTIVDLDSIYWILSVFFYFVSNNIFFLFSNLIPFSDWSVKSVLLKVFIFGGFLPVIFSAKRLKKRLLRKKKISLRDDEVYFIFHWAQRVFVYSFYFLIWYVSFFVLSVIIPFLYLYLTDFNFSNFMGSFYLTFIKDFIQNYKYVFPIFDFFFNSNFFYFGGFVFKYVFQYAFFLFNLYLFPSLSYFISLSILKFISFFTQILINIFFYFISFLNFYSFFFFNFLKLITIFNLLFKPVTYLFYDLNAFLDVFKNFLFSDNFFILLWSVFCFVFGSIFNFIMPLFTNVVNFFSAGFVAILPQFILEPLVSVFSRILDSFLILVFSNFIKFLDLIVFLSNTYLKDLTFFGFLSVWYENLNQGLQRGIMRNSLVNWAFFHIYASIIAFWFLDFDFRVSVKTPPRTPHTLLKEAKRTQEWVPQSMDFLTLQTTEIKIYFAMLDMSFEHVESLQFIYGDFEYIDEEWDEEDETPDEEELFNESEETLKVREIIESDLGFTNRPKKMSEDGPLESESGLERHHIGEIIGEPELVYIEDSLIWMFSSLYSPTFEELHYKDSLFSDWIFDPDEDLTFFEFLLLFPFLFYCVYAWFFHRRKRKHYRIYLRFSIPVRKRVFSGWWVEDFLGIPLGSWGRYFFDKMRHHVAPDVQASRIHKFRMYRARQKFKLMQLEAFHFERLRLNLYRKTLFELSRLSALTMKHIFPNRRVSFFRSTFNQFHLEIKLWVRSGDLAKYYWKPDFRSENTSFFYDSLQVSLNRLMERYLNRHRNIKRKWKKNLWRAIEHIPGHLSMPYYPKQWYIRSSNIFFYFPTVETKYNYSYYNYLGWRNNRSQWKRYAFTPGNVTDKSVPIQSGFVRRDYNLYRKLQKKRRLMRVFQF